MKQVALWLAATTLVGCSGDPTGASDGRIAVSDVVGVWSLTTTNAACVPGTISLPIPDASGEVQPGGSLTFASTWSAAGTNGPLHGTVNVNSRSVILRLFAAPGSQRVASIEGAIKDTLGTRVLYAQLVDPYAGLSTLFGAVACTSDVSGTRTSGPQ